MIKNKPLFWRKKNNIYSLLLLPISILFQILIKIKKRFTIIKKFEIPIICVGNIYIGGTGKTPLSIFIANELKKKSKNPVIVKKYYKKHFDEHELIKSKHDSFILNKSRIKALLHAEREKHDVAILDDGFQDYSIKKNINILCFHSNQLIGNGYTIPSGPLRESIKSVKNADIIIINGDKNLEFEKYIYSISNKINIFYSKYIPSNLELFKTKKIFAFAGIGNPDNFFQILENNKINVKKKLMFPDHYNFSKLEIQKMISYSLENDLELITTEKDFYRIKKLGFKKINFLRVDLEIGKKDEFLNYIEKKL